MRAVVQRVSQSSVAVDGRIVGKTNRGLLVLTGVAQGDTPSDARYLAEKIAGLRVFNDANGKMNLSVQEVSGSILVISQFTLLGDVRRGKRPSFTCAAEPTVAFELYQLLCQLLEEHEIPLAQGIFQADMQISLINDGPVTILLDSRKLF